MTSHQIVAVDVPRPPAEDGRVERTATAGRTLGAGGSAGTNRTRAQLLAQLENEQAAGCPDWRDTTDTDFRRLLEILDQLLRNDPPNVVRLHRYARRAA